MNISVEKCLTKMAEELRLAKGCVQEAALREKIYSIKILCELILDERPAAGKSFHTIQSKTEPHPLHQPETGSKLQPKKLEIDDANGETLFDF